MNMSNSNSKRQRVSGDSSSPLRTAIACRACRDRKTRCSGHQPTCTYCFKAGLPCEYGPSVVSATPSNLDEWGAKILAAIDNISVPPAKPDDSAAVADNILLHNLSPGLDRIPIGGLNPITSVPSIIKWKVFTGHYVTGYVVRYGEALDQLENQPLTPKTRGRESASCAVDALLSLADIFEAHFLPDIPILDSVELRRYIVYIGEYEDMWTVEACLVLLVAALASKVKTEPAIHQHGSVPVDMSLRYWTMAKKRLAWAFEKSSIVAAQCQLLAGIWYIYSSQPSVASKMLNGALLAVDTEVPSWGHSDGLDEDHHRRHSVLCDNIRYTCANLTCRLQCESEIPAPFTAYNLGDMNASPGTQLNILSSLKSLLLLRQRIVTSFRTIRCVMSVQELGALHKSLLGAVQSLDNWRTGLPAHLKSLLSDDIADVFGTSNELLEIQSQCKLLQWQYLEARELVMRPSLFVVLHATQPPQEAQKPDASGSQVTPEDVMWEYYMTRFHSMAVQHRSLVLLRLKSFLDHESLQNLQPLPVVSMDIGWLKVQTYFGLGLILIASARFMSNSEASADRSLSWGPIEEEHILRLEDWLRHESDISRLGYICADLLQGLRLAPCNESVVFPQDDT